MELKVWVEGIQRIVCGVTDSTTCQDVVFALAHATGKSGRFTLIERWRNNERQLAPNENPLKILLKWGEYSNDVQFILQWSDRNKVNPNSKSKFGTATNTNNTQSNQISPDSTKDVHKPVSFGNSVYHGSTSLDNIAIVKGVPQLRPPPVSIPSPISLEVREPQQSPQQLLPSPKQQQLQQSLLLSAANQQQSLLNSANCQQQSLLSTANQQQLLQLQQLQQQAALLSSPGKKQQSPPYKEPPAPPPYRDPPPPPPPPVATTTQVVTSGGGGVVEEDEGGGGGGGVKSRFGKIEETVVCDTRYKELISLVNCQREKLSLQQADITKFDAEILFWESKEREKQFQLDFISQDMTTLTNTGRITSEQIQNLNRVEEENEIVKQQEKTLQSEITLLRSKLANCETELLQCKNKIRLVMDEVQLEQRAQLRRSESRKQMERNLLAEMDRLQRDVEVAKQSTELHHVTADTLRLEVSALEAAIVEKKRQVERLVTEMKEANLQSLTANSAILPGILTVANQQQLSTAMAAATMAANSSDEQQLQLQQQSEILQQQQPPPQNRTGSTRKMIGSPRQLENAVPTNKNPHGVWV